jgi:magnesium transporter
MKDNYLHKTQYNNFVWIDICQPDWNSLDKIAQEFNLDYFQIKDSLEQGHLPKFEKQPNYNFLILRAFTSTIEQGETTISGLSNKIAFFFSDQKIITIHRSSFDFMQEVLKDVDSPEEILVYLISKMVKTYQEPLQVLDEKIVEIEELIFLKSNAKISLEDLYYIKAQTRITKKLLHIFQNVVNQIDVGEKSKTALQDIKDNLLNLILNYDEVLENANNLLNTYLSVSAQKSNDVMKLLTIFSAFFLPLTFVAGIYGMNFQYMPELQWQSGYFLILGIMAAIAIVIYVWFKQKKIL